MFQDGTSLFVGSSRRLYKFPLSTFGPSVVYDSEDNDPGGYGDIALAVRESGALFAEEDGQINGYLRSSLSSGRELGSSGWFPRFLLDTYVG
ncbi:MAG: hypothetical protein ACOCZB_03050 [Spirochaetota bacterium]